MPLLDVSDVLLDPDFLDQLTVQRNLQSVNSFGVAVNTPLTAQPIPFWGVVTSDRGKRLDRGMDSERISQSIWVITKFRLSDGSGTGQTADIVTWNARQYVVTHIDDYSRYGQGFIQAICEALAVSG